MKKNLINSVLLFAAALLLLFGVVYAWITLTPAVRVQQFVVNVNNYSADLRLDIKRNDDEYTEAVSAADIYELFHNTLPNDRLYFRLSITNNGNHPVTADIWMLGVFSENENEGYDMLDVFFLDGGKFVLDGTDYPVAVEPEEPVIRHGQELNLYRLNNIIDANHDFQIFDDLEFSANQTRVLEFILVYDQNTEALGYQGGILSIAAINIIFNITGE